MKKKSKSILAIVLAILLILVVAVTLTTNILFSRKETPKLFGHYIYMMESDVMEAKGASPAVATGVTGADASDGSNDAASIHQHTAVIASVYDESDPIAKNNAVLCILAPEDTSTDMDEDGVAVRRIYNIEQDETGVLKYYPTTMQAETVGTEPPVTVDSILGKCIYESSELYTFVNFATGVAGILTLLILPAVILVIMLIVVIARANGKREDEFVFEEDYDEVYSEDSYDDGYGDEELGGRSPLFRQTDTAQSRSMEKKRSSIADNFERKAVNPNSPYQKARTMQFKAQHDVPIYTNPEDQIPYDSRDSYRSDVYRGNAVDTPPYSAPVSGGAPASHAADTPVQTDAPVSTYRGSHEASSPDEARGLGASRFGSSRTETKRPASEKPADPEKTGKKKYETASVDELLAMIESEKKKLDE